MINMKKQFGDKINWDLEADRAVREDKDLFYTDFEGLLKLKQYKPTGKLLDCGCNIGRFIKIFENAGYKYTGVDQSEHALSIAKQYHPKGNFIRSFLWDVKFKYKFDIAFTNAVLQHNTLNEKREILQNIHTILKKRGILMIAESTVDVETKTQLTYEGWIKLIESFGFRLIESWHENELGLYDNYIFEKV